MTGIAGGAALAAVLYERGFDVDALLLAACARLRAAGVRVGGMIQTSSGGRGACAASVQVVDLASGQAFDIWESRGVRARGCRLDEAGLLETEPLLRAAIADGVDLLVINRFGRAEGLGRGVIGVFAAAIEAGVPVLTATRPPYDAAWRAFHGGMGRDLMPDPDAVLTWALLNTRVEPAHSPSPTRVLPRALSSTIP